MSVFIAKLLQEFLQLSYIQQAFSVHANRALSAFYFILANCWRIRLKSPADTIPALRN